MVREMGRRNGLIVSHPRGVEGPEAPSDVESSQNSGLSRLVLKGEIVKITAVLK